MMEAPELDAAHPYLGGLPLCEQRWLAPRLHQHIPPLVPERRLPCPDGTIHFLVDAVATVLVPVRDGRAIEVGFAGPDQVVGALALVGDQPLVRHGIWRHGHVLSLQEDATSSLGKHAAVLERRLRRAAGNEGAMLARAITRRALCTAQQRVAAYILDLHIASQDMLLPVSHEDIAQSLGLRRATVTLALQQLESAHAVRARRGEVEIADAEKLELSAGEGAS